MGEQNNNKINSKEYWNQRFQSDWKDYSGNEQTQFFASTLLSLLPEWLVHEINESSAAICDIGCAEGDALPIYRKLFLTSSISGEDFSEAAISSAMARHPEFSFHTGNILEPEGKQTFPLVICSNVLEHFKDTYHVLSCICSRSSKYTVVMIPYREKPGAISEHEVIFHTDNILTKVENNYLVYAKSVPCTSMYYSYEQILLVYSKDPTCGILAAVSENVNTESKAALSQNLEEEKANAAALQDNLKEALTQAAQWEEKFQAANFQNEQLDAQLSRLKEKIASLEAEALAARNRFSEKNAALSAKIDALKEEHSEEIASLTASVSSANAYAAGLLNDIQVKNEYLQQAESLCQHFATGKLMKLNHFLFRVKGQLLHGSREDKKEFRTWLRGRIRHTNRTIGEGVNYNPWMVVAHKLTEAFTYNSAAPGNGSSFTMPSVSASQGAPLPALPEETKQILAQPYTKYDVIILSVIDYNFRHQRPQHFATRFAANGHRVFYVNANFIRPDSITKEAPNLYIADFFYQNCNAIYGVSKEADLPWMQEKFDALIYHQAIKDAVVIVDYPNWVQGALYLRQKYGFKLVTDYMDDYTGFLGTADNFLKDNCTLLLQESDCIAASSQFLYDIAKKYASSDKIEIIRNGTEVDHFYQAYSDKPASHDRKVIGYYGAVSHWFAWEKICYLAQEFADCDIVIVGAVTEYGDKFQKFDNIKLLGEKPYKELPKYLADFDVCLIPFDTSTDLIKATNPVKFYEYLSAGKKIVATEIPELMTFRDRYVYMSNDDKQFAAYVRMCLDGTDQLAGAEDCIHFARENDWQQRYECFEQACCKHIPLVSIIVLTYNNLEFNKNCIHSILNTTAYANYELIIVDNQSTDGTVEYLKELEAKKLPQVKIILNPVNSGFAGGNNLGIREAKGDYVLLLNNDTVISRGWLTAMTSHLENDKKLGMCNPVTNSIGNESKIPAAYQDPVSFREFAYAYTAKHAGEMYPEVDRLPLFATLIRRDVIEKAGMLDEEYKIGMFEDDDYTEAVKAAGYQITISEDAFIHHINNASFKKLDDEQYKKIFEANKAIFEKKWHKKWSMPHYRKGVNWDTNCQIKY